MQQLALLNKDRDLQASVSHTTRKPRPGEVDGGDYHFVDEVTFLDLKSKGEFLESAECHGSMYGTSKKSVQFILDQKKDVILEIDWQGAQALKAQFKEAVSIFVLPPSVETLAERLNSRGHDSEETIAMRLAVAREEMSHVDEFDYVTINDDFEVALHDLMAIIRSTRLMCHIQLTRHSHLIKNLT
ncbi:Gmk Guanylate kinase [Candidatus Methylopumilus universalis]